MKKLIVAFGLFGLLAIGAQAQNTNLAFMPGKLVVLRGGDGFLTIASQRQHPAFIDEYDPVTNNQASPIMSVELPTNGVNSMWFNAHAGSEGQGFTRSADRQYLAVTGYHGDINEIYGTPSSTNVFTRGFGIIDAFTNFTVQYASQEWFGIQPGITQNNPRGVATDGNGDFWGCGTIAGAQSGGFSESGTLFWNNSVSPDPEVVQSIVNSAYFMKIINGVLYMVAKAESGGALNNGIYNFVDFSFNGGAPVPLPWSPGGVQHIVTTNLFLNFGSTYTKVLAFDMNSSNTIVYAADTTLGIAKFVNIDGAWSNPYYFSATNLGTLSQPKGGQGCFGIAVDFSGTNPVIYATTMEEGDGANTCSNRLIRIVDTGNPGTNLVAETLAVANGVNEVFRGVDFTPDLRPSITSQPADVSTTTNAEASFSVNVSSVYPLSYQWQENGTNIADDFNISGSASNYLDIAACSLTNQGAYSVIVTNFYGSVTSSVANLTVAAVAAAPSYTNALKRLTNFIGDAVTISGKPNSGTQPFAFQWYFGDNLLSDGSDGQGSGYIGSTNSTLIITNVQLSDAGNYSIAVTNSVDGISNLVAELTVQYRPPTIPSGGQPAPLTLLLGQTNSLSVSSISGTPPISYQWYQGNTNPVMTLTDAGEFSGSATNTLTISGATVADATNYFCVITNLGGSITSQVASVTVIIPPPASYVAYTNQIYAQNFDSLPNPGDSGVNTVSHGGAVSIGGVTYSLSDPFDFAFPVYFPSGNIDGLGLSNTMAGWYGETDVNAMLGEGSQLGAHDGDQTTGGIISFGTYDSNNTNRSLGLIATSTSGGAHFGLKLINLTATNLNYVSLNFLGEYWKSGTKPKTMAFTYLIDSAGTNSVFTMDNIASSTNNTVDGLSFGYPYFGTGAVGPTNGTISLGVTNLALSASWQPGAALWLIWSINDDTGSGQGYGIDNLSFSATSGTNATVIMPISIAPGSTRIIGSGASDAVQFTFTNASGLNFSILATNNISAPVTNWPVIGTAVENPAGSGNYQFTDPTPATNAARFYILRQP